MSELLQETINNSTKSELKTELSKQDLALTRKNKDLAKRITET